MCNHTLYSVWIIWRRDYRFRRLYICQSLPPADILYKLIQIQIQIQAGEMKVIELHMMHDTAIAVAVDGDVKVVLEFERKCISDIG